MALEFSGRDRRRTPRVALSLAASLRERGRSGFTVRLVDLSSLGCRIELHTDIAPGTWVWLKLPRLEAQYSRVAWCRGCFAGIEFDTALHEGVVDLLAGMSARLTELEKDELRRISARCRQVAERAAGLPDEEANAGLLALAADCDSMAAGNGAQA